MMVSTATSFKPALAPENPNKKRNGMFRILFSVVAVAAIAYGAYYYLFASHHITTDNAYVGAEIAQVTSAIGGTIEAIQVNDTDIVKAGDVLVVIDDTDAQLAVARAKAELAKAQVELDRRQLDADRRSKLAKSGSVSAEEVSNADNALRAAKATFDVAETMAKQAEVDLARTTIRAPIDGVVAKRMVQLGQRVPVGMQLMSIVPSTSIHVDANFKEVQLRKIKIGQPVKLTSDMYGSSVTYTGKVAGISGGTGSAFAIIPAQNATGNWIKVVQRIPVRIQLDPEQLKEYPLHVGLSMNADIDISG